jgi:hypothetical protein
MKDEEIDIPNFIGCKVSEIHILRGTVPDFLAEFKGLLFFFFILWEKLVQVWLKFVVLEVDEQRLMLRELLKQVTYLLTGVLVVDSGLVHVGLYARDGFCYHRK